MIAKKSKLQTKEFAKSFKQCILQLKKIREENGLVQTETEDVLQQNEELKTTEFKDIKEMKELKENGEVKNAWGQKDLNFILKEKNERLNFLENELEDRKQAYQKLEQEKKKARVEFEKEQKDENFEKILHEKDKEVTALMLESDTSKRKIGELEMQLQQEKKANEVLKEASQYVNEISSRKPITTHRLDYMSNLKKFLENEQEIQRLLALNSTNERELSHINQSHKDCGSLIESLKAVIEDLEKRIKFKTFSKEIEMNDIESVLMDEIDNITSAYDKICTTNMLLEKNLLDANSRITEVLAENFLYKNRLGQFEDNKAYLEKEKKRMEDWKTTLAEDTRKFQEKWMEMENSINEKDRKAADYKIIITNLQASQRILQADLDNTNLGARQSKRELDALKAEFLHLKNDHESNKKLCDLFKGFCTSDVEVVEDLERYKKVLRCSLCDTNIKNCVLVKCSHTFCDCCIEDRLKARQRKCPICQTDFSSNDIKKMFL